MPASYALSDDAIQQNESIPRGALAGDRHRVIVSTDIGGTDPDDFQSMVHLLVYADVLDIEGLIASPYGKGRAADILRVIDCYEADYENLRSHSAAYPTPDALRSITKQGATQRAPYAGVRHATEGSKWIIECAERDDPRPLHVLVWGGLEDLAQALDDTPEILPKLRVYWIGGPNKKWSPDAYQYLVENHPALWMIESNAAYRGWFVGGDQSGEWGNHAFVTQHVRGRGELGGFFHAQIPEIKMGDTPSVGWLLRGNPTDPTSPGWGGSYTRAWERPRLRLDRMPTPEDRIEVYGILELALPIGDAPANTEALLVVENQSLPGYADGSAVMRFRFCPKAAKEYGFRIESNVDSLEGVTGGITSEPADPALAGRPTADLPNWWTDDLSAAASDGPHSGARTVSRWRVDFLKDFAERMRRCEPR